jgi:ribosomal protein S18 acetylase RimI-like enzyme
VTFDIRKATKPEFRQRGFARSLIHKAKWIAGNSKFALVAYPENITSRKLLVAEHFRRVPGRRSAEGHPQYRFSVKA